MKETELINFIKWLPTQIKEFQDKTPEEIAEILNQMSKTEQGKSKIEELINEFNSKTEMFREGGKLNYLVEKFKNGSKYNRKQARQNKEAAGLYYIDENTGQQLRNPIDKGNLKAKVAKAKAVDGYQDETFVNNFDRDVYRGRKRALKQTNPELSRRERKAEALLAHKTSPNINPDLIGPIGYEKITFQRPKSGIVTVGDISSEIIPNPVLRPAPKPNPIQSAKQPLTPKNLLNWNEFAHAIETRLRNDNSFRAGMDYKALQALMESEYKRYNDNPDNYKFDNYQLQGSRFNKYRNRDLTMPQPIYRSGYGDFDQNTDYLFDDSPLRAVPTSATYEAMTKGISYPIMATTTATAALPAAILGIKELAGVAREAGKQAIKRGRESDLYPHLRRQFGDRYNLATTQGGGKYGNAPYYLPEGTLSNYLFFKKGGTLTNKFEKGGKQRKSDQFRKEFHGVDLFSYGPDSRRRSGYIYDAESLPSGIKTDVLPNGVGMRQITNKNITTTELVSPDKRDTLYIHNGVAGRVDSNINDAGFLGHLGLKESTPVSDRYKELQKKFNSRFSKKK